MDIFLLQKKFKEKLAQLVSLQELQDLKNIFLGKKGSISLLMKELGKMPLEERQEKSILYNKIRTECLKAFEDKKKEIDNNLLHIQLEKEKIDISAPFRPEKKGSIHPLSHTIHQLYSIFADMGFQLAQGPDIEEEYYNFTAVNIPEDHPSRQDHDTFYFSGPLKNRKLLRTHTSPVQIRTMLNQKPPLRILVPGRTYRCDDDATHSPNFHQVEGFVIDKDIHMGHLKYCLLEFCRIFFNKPDLKIRFRPHYFPFTEPSAEVDIQCEKKKDSLIIGQGTDWMEILGCGMIHPNVLKNGGIDPTIYRGFAFGMGIERITMLKYGIPDLRAFFDMDIRWHHHFGFSPLSSVDYKIGDIT